METASPRSEKYLEEVIRRNSSDLHLQVGMPGMLRIDGKLIKVEDGIVLNEKNVEDLVYAVID